MSSKRCAALFCRNETRFLRRYYGIGARSLAGKRVPLRRRATALTRGRYFGDSSCIGRIIAAHKLHFSARFIIQSGKFGRTCRLKIYLKANSSRHFNEIGLNCARCTKNSLKQQENSPANWHNILLYRLKLPFVCVKIIVGGCVGVRMTCALPQGDDVGGCVPSSDFREGAVISTEYVRIKFGRKVLRVAGCHGRFVKVSERTRITNRCALGYGTHGTVDFSN